MSRQFAPVRAAFWLLYHPLAFTYDLVAWLVSMGTWKDWQRSALDHLPPAPARVLDLAHGTGTLQLDLFGRGYRAIGLDFSPNMGQITRGKLRRARLPIRLTRARAQAMPFPDASFDAIISTFPAGFIMEADTLRECFRVLADEGRFIIVPSAAFTGGGLLRRVLEFAYRVTGQQTGSRDDSDLNVGLAHMHAFASRLLGPHGFNVTVHHKAFPRSITFVIVAQKQPSQTS